MAFIAEDEQIKVSEAITAAEKRTSGEIVAVIAAESASYLSVPFLVASTVALFVPWPLIYFTWMPVQWIFALQLLAFGLLALLLMPRGLRFRFVPRSILRGRAHRRAVEQFLTQDLDSTTGRTGVLVFVSVAERYAEIIADQALRDKVTAAEWQAIVDGMTAEIAAGRPCEGLVGAIGRVGDLMARHFPGGGADPRRLPDHLIVLD